MPVLQTGKKRKQHLLHCVMRPHIHWLVLSKSLRRGHAKVLIGFIAQSRLKDTENRFAAAAKKHGVDFHVLTPAPMAVRIKDCLYINDAKKLPVDGVINWDPYPAFYILENMCHLNKIPFINHSESVRIARNKMLTSLVLAGHNVPQPETFFLNRHAKKMPPGVTCPLVCKPLTGTQGRGISFFHDTASLKSMAENSSGGVYLQKFIPNKGWDLRVVVVGDRVIGAVKRYAKVVPGKNRVQIIEREPFQVNRQVEQLALRATRALKLHFAGIDIIRGRTSGKYYVLEVNAVPRLKTFEEATGISVAEAILKLMLEMKE